MMSMPIKHGGDSNPTITIKLAPSPSLTPLDVQMLRLPCYLERFAMRTPHSVGKGLQRPPLGAVTPPNGKA